MMLYVSLQASLKSWHIVALVKDRIVLHGAPVIRVAVMSLRATARQRRSSSSSRSSRAAPARSCCWATSAAS